MRMSSNGTVNQKLTTNLEAFEEKLARAPIYAPLFSWARFGPGSIAILLFILFITVELYSLGLVYFTLITGAVGVLLLVVKSMEIIQLSHPEAMKLIGQRCVVVREAGRGKMGVVKVYDSNGRLGPELWSADSEYEIHEGQEATVSALRSIVLIIKRLDCATNQALIS
jgi:membrane protein implicated in regulation of membrane protease activity